MGFSEAFKHSANSVVTSNITGKESLLSLSSERLLKLIEGTKRSLEQNCRFLHDHRFPQNRYRDNHEGHIVNLKKRLVELNTEKERREVRTKDSDYYEKIKEERSTVKLTWKNFHRDIQTTMLKELILYQEHFTKFKGVYGIPRGGLVMAVFFSNYFKMPLLQAPCDGCLIVDDTIDEGLETYPIIKKYIENNKALLAVWYIDKKLAVKYDALSNLMCFNHREPATWYTFPWEV